MAATHALLTAHCSAGDHVILPRDLYGGTYRLVDKVLKPLRRSSYDMVDQTDLDALERALRARDRADLGRDAHQPAAQRGRHRGRRRARRRRARGGGQHLRHARRCSARWSWAPHAVVHSATKYLGGHSDVVGGAVVVGDEDLHERVRFVQNAVGAVPGPVRLLPGAPRPAHAAPARGRPHRERRAP